MKWSPVYLGDWTSREDMVADYRQDIPETDQIIVAFYEYADYSGHADVLLMRDNEFYYTTGSHCSCYGLEGQYEPDRVNLPWIAEQINNKEFYYGQSRTFWKQHVAQFISRYFAPKSGQHETWRKHGN